MLSVIIPSFKDPLLHKTIGSLLDNSEGEIEIIPVLDGYWPKSQIMEDERIKILHLGKNRGMRRAINAGVSMSQGKYIMKSDSHCSFAAGFDKTLVSESKKKRIQIPTRKRLDAENWSLISDGRPDSNYLYLDKNYRGRLWNKKNKDKKLKSKLIDPIVAFQGSCYFLERSFWDTLDILDDKNFGGIGHESQEITFKCWLANGEVVRNKKTWYAHWHRTKGPVRDRSKSRECLRRWIKNKKRLSVINDNIQKYGHKTN
ncbi:glycosyltransferase [Patescibacteria group bacterium]